MSTGYKLNIQSAYELAQNRKLWYKEVKLKYAMQTCLRKRCSSSMCDQKSVYAQYIVCIQLLAKLFSYEMAKVPLHKV